MRGFDTWLTTQPEPKEVEITRECLWETEDKNEQIRICGFNGEVTGFIMHSTGWWTCPDCGHEHEIDIEEFAPDPDEAWDSRFDHDE